MITKKAFLGAAGYLAHNASYLAKVLRFPFVAYVLLNIAGTYAKETALVFVITFISIWFQAVIAIITHRVILTGSVSPDGGDRFKWGQKETMFVMYMVMFVGLAAPAIMMAVLSPLLGLAAALAVVWFVCRWSLVFPGLAVGHEMYLHESWRMTENNQLDMFIAVIVFPGVLLGIMLVFSLVPALSWFSSILAGLFVILQASVLSVIYKILYEDEPGKKI